MKALIGLGNPGEAYVKTRHNAGFWLVDAVAKELNLDFKNFQGGLLAKTPDFLLFKPQQYMNRSGEPIRALVDYFQVTSKNTCIAADDVYIAPGSVRIRYSGADGGHNGWKSVVEHLASTDYVRVRIGVGIYEQQPEKRIHQPPLDEYVTQPMPPAEHKQVFQLIDNMVPNLVKWLHNNGDLAEETIHI